MMHLKALDTEHQDRVEAIEIIAFLACRDIAEVAYEKNLRSIIT